MLQQDKIPPPSQASVDRVHYVIGNAKNIEFLKTTLKMLQWDAIVDFMVWNIEFSNVVNYILDSTKQYVFLSSARVYSECDTQITENTPRLLDVLDDSDYLKTNEYALIKAREENILKETGRDNYTIIRPYITYNTYRLQLGVLEKENWLYRALKGRSIVFSKDISCKKTTLTLGDDVSKGIAAIIGKKEALAEIFNITSSIPIKWETVLNVYTDVLEKHLGKRIPVVMTEKCLNLGIEDHKWQVKYDRIYNHSFDNKKIAQFCDVYSFSLPDVGLAACLSSFLERPSFNRIDWTIEAFSDRVSKEKTPILEIPGFSNRMNYLIYRYNLRIVKFLWRIILSIKFRIGNRFKG